MPVFRYIDPETAHRAALWALRLGLVRYSAGPDDPALAVSALGLAFSNPIGLAAGFDKDAVALRPLQKLGFGFVETGTVTLRPQTGNPRPRLFRLESDRAVINRMGFNNAGLGRYLDNLASVSAGRATPVGANLGLNREGGDPEVDYATLAKSIAPLVDYLVLNVSSPNTPNLRRLQAPGHLSSLLRAVREAANPRPALLVKIAPDLDDRQLGAIIETCIDGGAQGLIISNTTTVRPKGLLSHFAHEAGGLSGAPLFAPSTRLLARAFLLAGRSLTFIGVGGVSGGREALDKIMAGASLIQLYTALVFEGPGLVSKVKRELALALREVGFVRVEDAIGADARRLATLDH